MKTASLIQQSSVRKRDLEDCFRVMRLQQKQQQLFVPASVQFKIRNFTSVNFQDLTATVNGVLCVNFLIFTDLKPLQTFLCHRLYFNPWQERQLLGNRRKKLTREDNFVPLLFGKDGNVKLPTTRSKEFQIQSYKTRVWYRKNNCDVEGIRIFHIIRKEFNVEIKKNGSVRETFFAPFDIINLELLISMEHMRVAQFQYKYNEKEKDNWNDEERKNNDQMFRLWQQQEEYMGKAYIKNVKKVSFNLLRIQQPYRDPNMVKDQRALTFAPMIAYSCEDSFGKYDVVESRLQAYTSDEREWQQEEDEQRNREQHFKDFDSSKINFKPFKYVAFKIPLYRHPVVDMMTIFFPMFLLSFVSVYIYFQTTEILARIVNVAALMIAYAAIQPIVRQNLPEATSITLVDLLIYSELLINILFLVSSINQRTRVDQRDGTQPANFDYDRWSDPLFLIGLVIALLNVVVVAVLIIVYLCRKGGYKAKPLPKCSFSLSSHENWTLSLLMERTFARYKQTLVFFD